MVTVKSYESPPVNKSEILRYMGCRTDDSKILNLIDDCLKEAAGQLTYKVCYDVFDIAQGVCDTKQDISFNCDISASGVEYAAKTIENTISSSNGDLICGAASNISSNDDIKSHNQYGSNNSPFISTDEINLGFMKTESKTLAVNLDGCNCIVVFAATIGLGLDRLIAKYSRISPVKALCFQAIGAERIESLCNIFNKDVADKFADKGLLARPRFSPGYGDFELEAQKEIFKVLDCYRKIGLSLNESLLMSPSKSVTAVIGFSAEKSVRKKDDALTNSTKCENTCKTCNKFDCNFRRD